MTRSGQYKPSELERFALKARATMLDLQKRGEWAGGVKAHTEYQTKPVEWIVKYLGLKEETLRWSLFGPEYASHVWDGDVDPLVQALEEIAKGGSVAISSGTGTGKTMVAAAATLWFLACFENSIVISIGPRETQLLLNMWKEIGGLYAPFKILFPDSVLTTGKLRMLPEEDGGKQNKEKWAATALTAGVGADEEVAQKLAGSHAARMLYVIEETPGVDPAIMNTIINTTIGGFNPVLALGNPDHQHDTLGRFAAREWVKALRISAYDHPNIVMGADVIEGAVTIQSIERRKMDYGEDDPIFISRVRGIAPKQSQHSLIRWEWCEAAAKRWADEELREGPLGLGLDVADKPSGDRSALSRWQGAVCTEVVVINADDAGECARIVALEIQDPRNPVNPKYVGVDSVGVGASAVNEFKRLGIRIRRISGGMRAPGAMDVEGRWAETLEEDGRIHATGPSVVEAERYADTRAAVFWRLREDLRLGRIGLPNDRKLFEELTVIQYDELTGKITIEKKDKIKLRLGRSPDLADSVAYGNYVRSRRPEKTRLEQPEMRTTSNRDWGLEKRLTQMEKRQNVERKRLERQLARLGKRGRA